MKISLTLFLPALLSLLIVAQGGCRRDLPDLGEEIKRVPSPNSEVFAVLSWRDAGWDSLFVVSIFQTDELPRNPYSPIVFEAENVRDIEIFWLKPRTLAISYGEASIHEFRNHWYILESEEGLIQYDILLLPQRYFEDYIEKRLEKNGGISADDKE